MVSLVEVRRLAHLGGVLNARGRQRLEEAVSRHEAEVERLLAILRDGETRLAEAATVAQAAAGRLQAAGVAPAEVERVRRLALRSPRMAATATFALNSALCNRRFAIAGLPSRGPTTLTHPTVQFSGSTIGLGVIASNLLSIAAHADRRTRAAA